MSCTLWKRVPNLISVSFRELPWRILIDFCAVRFTFQAINVCYMSLCVVCGRADTACRLREGDFKSRGKRWARAWAFFFCAHLVLRVASHNQWFRGGVGWGEEGVERPVGLYKQVVGCGGRWDDVANIFLAQHCERPHTTTGLWKSARSRGGELPCIVHLEITLELSYDNFGLGVLYLPPLDILENFIGERGGGGGGYRRAELESDDYIIILPKNNPLKTRHFEGF